MAKRKNVVRYGCGSEGEDWSGGGSGSGSGSDFDPEEVISKRRVVEELASLALANYADLLDDTGRMLPKRLWPKGASAALKRIHFVNYLTPMGEVETVAMPEFHDKKGALATLARILRLDVQRQEISGPAGGPIEAVTILAEAADRVRNMRRTIKAAGRGTTASGGSLGGVEGAEAVDGTEERTHSMVTIRPVARRTES